MTLTAEDLARAEMRIPKPKRRRPPLTPGRVVYLTYHYPRQVWADGLWWHWHLWKGRQDLQRVLPRLQPIAGPGGAAIQIHYLTGHRFVPLTSIAVLSAQQHFGRPVIPVLHDDGTLDAKDRATFKRLFPTAILRLRAELDESIEETLPTQRFPFLRRIRLGYFHLRKLTDIQCAAGEPWRLVSDSDVFFFRRPKQLLACVENRTWCHMVDCGPAYGAPVETLAALADAPVHPQVNVGLCLLNQPSIDWEFVEHCARVLLARHGFSYYFEQALTAVLMGRHGATPLCPTDYLVYPRPEQAEQPTQVALHYVDRSMLAMMRFGWRQVVANTGSGVMR